MVLVELDIAVVDRIWMNEISEEWLWLLWGMVIKCEACWQFHDGQSEW